MNEHRKPSHPLRTTAFTLKIERARACWRMSVGSDALSAGASSALNIVHHDGHSN